MISRPPAVGGIASILNVQGASIHDDPAFGGLADPVCRATICGQAGAALDGQFMNRAALAYDEAVGDFARLGDVDIAAADIEPGEATQSEVHYHPPSLHRPPKRNRLRCHSSLGPVPQVRLTNRQPLLLVKYF